MQKNYYTEIFNVQYTLSNISSASAVHFLADIPSNQVSGTNIDVRILDCIN